MSVLTTMVAVSVMGDLVMTTAVLLSVSTLPAPMSVSAMKATSWPLMFSPVLVSSGIQASLKL